MVENTEASVLEYEDSDGVVDSEAVITADDVQFVVVSVDGNLSVYERLTGTTKPERQLAPRTHEFDY